MFYSIIQKINPNIFRLRIGQEKGILTTVLKTKTSTTGEEPFLTEGGCMDE